jgi:hypothetical protein
MHAIPRTVDSSCSSFATIGYAIPPKQADGGRALPDDPGNRYDTEQTVADLQQHNARWDALCGRTPARP